MLLVCAINTNANESILSGRQIIENYIEAQKADSELVFINMRTVLNDDKISNKYQFLILAQKNSDFTYSAILRIIRPQDVAGVTLLTLEKLKGEVEQYFYLPELGKITKIRDDNKSNSFLDSDFNYEDLLNEISTNFQYELLKDSILNGAECYVVRAMPASKAHKSTYSHRDLYIEKESFNILKIEFYTAGDYLLKTLVALDYDSPQIKGNTNRPHRAIMKNWDNKSTTTFTVIESRLNINLDDELFTPQKIANWSIEEVSELISIYNFYTRVLFE